MKLIIAGGRDFNDYYKLEKYLTEHLDAYVNTDIEIVSGGARGADSLGELFARNHSGMTLTVFPADWNTYGKRAGYIRNVEMAEYADSLVACWNLSSRGTKHMIDTARTHGLDVNILEY